MVEMVAVAVRPFSFSAIPRFSRSCRAAGPASRVRPTLGGQRAHRAVARGAVFHARGLINSRAIQHNLDWVWPFWVERQFDPRDDAFVPRAFSITHVNLTHRNWTAIGLPDSDWYPLVDPRGMVTPHEDGWSLDFWIVPDDGTPLLPSRCDHATQRLLVEDRLAVETKVLDDHGRLHSCVEVLKQAGQSHCRIDLQAIHDNPAWLAVAIRPANPEGVSFIHEIAWQAPDKLISRRKTRNPTGPTT